jgi:hypothetical protein
LLNFMNFEADVGLNVTSFTLTSWL